MDWYAKLIEDMNFQKGVCEIAAEMKSDTFSHIACADPSWEGRSRTLFQARSVHFGANTSSRLVRNDASC